nr:reverse transcriptase domain-containing protein [Tanacetum cinerariifolium]
MSTSGIPSLQEVDGSNKGSGSDEVGSGIGNSGGVPIDGVLDSGARINVDGAVDLIRTIDDLVRESIIGGGGGSGVNIGNGVRNGVNGYDVGETGDSGGVGMASNLSTSDSEGNVIAKLTHAVNQQTRVVTTAMTVILKQFQVTPPLAFVKAVEEICVTCGGAYPYYQCLVANGNTFLGLRDNIQGYVSAAVVNYNQGSGPIPSNTIANPKGKLKSINTRSGLVLDGPSVHMPPPFINPEEDERVEETLTDQDLGLPELISTRMTLELANQAICTPSGIASDVFVLVGKVTFPADFIIFYYKSDPRVPLILGRPFLRTARALINVHGEEMILHDDDERLTLNMRHDTSIYSNQHQKESINMINVYHDSCEDFHKYLFVTNHPSRNPTCSSHSDLTSPEVKDDIFDPEGDNVLVEKLINLDSTKDLPLPYNINPLSGSTTSSSSSNHLLEEFTNELALITFPPGNDDLSFDIESDFKEIEYLLNNDPIKKMDSILEDSIDESNLADPNENLNDTMPEMLTDEHALDYSSPPLYDEYDDDLDEFESDNDDAYNDPFDSKGEKNQRVDALPSTNNEDKVFNPGILFQENLFEFNTCVTPNKNVKKIAISHASLIIKDFNPPLSDCELPFHKEVPGSKTLLSFSSENEEKFSNLGFSLLNEFIFSSPGIISSGP